MTEPNPQAPAKAEGPRDSVVRAITRDGGFRVITLATTHTVRGAIAAQHAAGQTARAFADLLTGTILVRETMAPPLRVQGIIRGQGRRGTLVADSHPDGATRGLVQLPKTAGDIQIGQGALLQMMRTMPSGAVTQGVVEVGSASALSEAFMTYMQESEQVTAVLAVGAKTARSGEAGDGASGDGAGDGATEIVERAGGYIVQLLPEATRGAQMIMTERLDAFAPIESLLADPDFSPKRLLDELLFGMPYVLLDESPLRYECHCSLERVLATLATLGPADIAELVGSGEVIEMSCDYCLREYQIPPEQLRALLEAS